MIQNLFLLILSIIIHNISIYPVYKYSKKNKNQKPLYDIGHQLISPYPRFNFLGEIVWFYFFILIIYLYINKKIDEINKLFKCMYILYLLRAVSFNLTYLPLPKKCLNKPPFLNGGCGDLMFSAHYMIFTLIAFILFKKCEINIFVKIFFIISFIISICFTLSCRNHYSNDIFISIAMSYFVAEKVFCEEYNTNKSN